MTEHITPAPDGRDVGRDDEMADDFDPVQAADLELIISALNGHLSPERVAEVTRRLEEDPAFRDFAAPMLLTWSVPSYLERHPRPVGELETAWNEFAERAGITQPPVQKGWRDHPMWRRIRFPLIALLVVGLAPYVVVGVSALLAATPLREWYVTRRDFAVVPYREGWIPLGDSIHVELAPDATLRAARVAVDDVRHVVLDGTAQFRVLALDSITTEPRRAGILVRTRGGVVDAGESEFTVTTHGDTTDVELLRPSRRRFMWFVPLPTAILVKRDTASDPLMLRELDRARLVRNKTPERVRAQP